MKHIVFIALILMALVAGCSNTVASTEDESFQLVGSNAKFTLSPGIEASGVFSVVNNIKSPPREVRIQVDPEGDADLKGWQQLPKGCYSWFTVEPSSFFIGSGESREIRLIVNVPKDTQLKKGKYRCQLTVLPWAVVGQVEKDGEMVNVVSNVCFGAASELYITMK